MAREDVWVTDNALEVLGARGRLRSLDIRCYSGFTGAGLEAVALGCGLGRRLGTDIHCCGRSTWFRSEHLNVLVPNDTFDAAAAQRLKALLPP